MSVIATLIWTPIGVWIGLRVEHYPFGLLTMIVSLEAIFLSTFVMISQNRQAARTDLRSQLDFENNIRAEIWSVHIGEALGLDVEHVEATVRRAIEGAQEAMKQAYRASGIDVIHRIRELADEGALDAPTH